MLPYLSLFGRLMPTYGVLGMAGLGFGLLAALLRCKRFGLSRDDCAYLYILGAVGALVGAKLLYLLPLLPRLAVELPLLWEEPGEFYARYLSGGMVFYGGFFGGVAAAWGAAKYLRLRLSDFFPVLVPALPYLLGFAAGAMLYVVVEEMIPEMSQGRHSHIGVLAFAAGFSVMMVLDVALG